MQGGGMLGVKQMEKRGKEEMTTEREVQGDGGDDEEEEDGGARTGGLCMAARCSLSLSASD